jgi:hypothetical protein
MPANEDEMEDFHDYEDEESSELDSKLDDYEDEVEETVVADVVVAPTADGRNPRNFLSRLGFTAHASAPPSSPTLSLPSKAVSKVLETCKAFLSYAHNDLDFALKVSADLRASGASIWVDRLDIRGGQRWDEAIEDALENCSRVLVILSPSAISSPHVKDEINYALNEGKEIIPIWHQDCKIPYRLGRLQYIDFRTEYKISDLLGALGTLAPLKRVPTRKPGAKNKSSRRIK